MLFRYTEYILYYEDGRRHGFDETTFWSVMDRREVDHIEHVKYPEFEVCTFFNSSGIEIGKIYKWGNIDIKIEMVDYTTKSLNEI